MEKRPKRKNGFGIPAWIILAAVMVLGPLFLFMTLQNIEREKEFTTELLLEKGAALIRSFEAGTRTGMMGMMGMHGGGFQLQRLLTETAQQSDIVHLIVTDVEGIILAHNNPNRIGRTYGEGLDLQRIADSMEPEWRQLSNTQGIKTFEVFRKFRPIGREFRGFHGRMMHNMFRGPLRGPVPDASDAGHIIFVGLDMGPIEAARKADTQHAIIMGLILLLIGFAGMVSLFLAQAYRTARTRLTRIKAFSDNVVENMPIGLVAINPDGTLVSFNQTAESVLGIPSKDILGKNASEALPTQIACLTREIETDAQVVEQEIDCPLDNGRTLPMDVSASTLRGEDGAFLGHIILFRDLSEIRNLKREVERSRRLASLGRLAAGIAHEIRNPLSSIKGFATYFKDRYQEVPEDQKTAEIMIAEVERLNRVIGQLLEFARPVSIRKKPASLPMLIQQSLKMIEREAADKQIRIEKNLPPEMREVPLDVDRMSQVLLNLYLNAMESMERHGTLTVDLIQAEDPPGAKIRVTDTGSGIPKEDRVHIFDPYFTTKQTGTGLGLAIVHKIVESHEGEVTVESVTGQGTTVEIFLPGG